jgi:tRNA pseudouridine55 synthase
LEGIIVVDKPQGITSFDVIRELRKILKERRIGHTGTLDPLATGILVVCVGRATKLAQDIEGYDKTYVAGFELGYRTDTYDIEGKVVERHEVEKIDEAHLQETLKNFIGIQEQIPPMYSAIKVDGKKLYELAREGKEVERAAREIYIGSLELLEFDGVRGKIKCKVSKGTYIRSLIDDLGKALGTFATMTSLRRTAVGEETLERSFTLEEIKELMEAGEEKFMHSVENYFKFPRLELNDEKVIKLFLNGNPQKYECKNGKYRIYIDGKFVGLSEVKNGILKAYKYY